MNDQTPAALTALLSSLDGLTPDQIAEAVRDLPPDTLEHLLNATAQTAQVIPKSPLEQALALEPLTRRRPHLDYLNERLTKAIHDVENGKSRYLRISMPPRMGKSWLTSLWFPVWIFRQHPEWKIGLVSHSGNFSVTWGRNVRRIFEGHDLGVELAKDNSSAAEWETTARGGMLSRGISGDITGRGFKVLIMDDVVKGFEEAHSIISRESTWNKWTADLRSRLEPPSLVIAIATRWHEDDIIGRLISPEFDGDPEQWETIEFPAIAEEHDILGRQPGQPLISPLLEETDEEALARWADIRRSVGSYNWDALYQQRPSSASGAIFNRDWWRFWTSDPAKISRLENGEPDPNGKVVYFDPAEAARSGGSRWLDSWDCAFKATSDSDYVVGQRWVQRGPNKYLVHQARARLTFTQTVAAMLAWGDHNSTAAPFSRWVHERLVEDKANGTAVLDVLRQRISGMIPVNPTDSKEGRARSITPDIEAGNVFLPLPTVRGNEWVNILLDETRAFPTGAHDDTVDCLTQALARMRTGGHGSITVPGQVIPQGINRQLPPGPNAIKRPRYQIMPSVDLRHKNFRFSRNNVSQ